jgi:hypothetical protein
MKNLFLTLLLLSLILGIGIEDAFSIIPAAERNALIALYNSTDGDNWTNNNGWKDPPLDLDDFAMPGTEGNWYGITLDAGGTTLE